MPTTLEQSRTHIHDRLQARRPEIEAAVMTRVSAVFEHPSNIDPDYTQGLRAAVSVATGYALIALERGEERAAPFPPALLAQARLAARNAVGLDIVLRRYFAGYGVVGEFVVQEAEDAGMVEHAQLQRLLRGQAALFDRLIEAVSEEHARELAARLSSDEQRRAERIDRLLAGEVVDTSGLGYDFDAHQLGLIASAPGAFEAVRALASSLDRLLLSVRRDEDIVWAWLGGRRPLDTARLRAALSASWPEQLPLAFGEPAEGLRGWRLTHRQARAAMPVAQCSRQAPVHYADVALLASILQDDLLATSLCELYLEPLERDRDGGEAARRTLRAYFDADCNVSSAAAALGINRNTVSSRLRAVEETIGRPISACATDIDAALRLAELAQQRDRQQAAR